MRRVPTTVFGIAALGVATAALVAGCAASTPAPVLLSVPAAPAETNTAPPAAGAAAVTPRLLALGRVEIPEYLVARRVRYRADRATLAEWPNTYWGERIEAGVSREFGSALRRRLAGWTFCESDCAGRAPALGMRVEIAPLDFLRAERRLEARARITIVEGDLRARPLRSAEFDYTIPAGADTPQAEAEAIGVLVGRVAADAVGLIGP